MKKSKKGGPNAGRGKQPTDAARKARVGPSRQGSLHGFHGSASMDTARTAALQLWAHGSADPFAPLKLVAALTIIEEGTASLSFLGEMRRGMFQSGALATDDSSKKLGKVLHACAHVPVCVCTLLCACIAVGCGRQKTVLDCIVGVSLAASALAAASPTCGVGPCRLAPLRNAHAGVQGRPVLPGVQRVLHAQHPGVRPLTLGR